MGNETEWVALFDWDETLHDGQTMPAWVDFLETYRAISGEHGQAFRRVFEVYEKSPKGAADYNRMITDAVNTYARAVRGKSIELLTDLAWQFMPLDSWKIFPFVPELIERLKSDGVRPVLVTGSALVVAEAYAQQLGIECAHAVKLAVQDGRFTGAVERNTGLAPIKRAITDRYAGRVLVAGGDSNADLPMFEAAEFAVIVGNVVNDNLARTHRNRLRIANPQNLDQPELWERLDGALRGRTLPAVQRMPRALQ